MTVARLSVTPVKGLALHHPESVDLTTGGVEGDRAFFLVDAAGEMASCTDIGALMTIRADYDAASDVLTVHGPDGVLHSATVSLGASRDTDFYGERVVSGHLVDGWDDVFSAVAGQPLRLVRGTTGAFDVANLTLIGSSTTAALASASGLDAVDARRFRMNVEVAGSAPLDEDSWDGRELALGDTRVRVGRPVKRCAATTRNPDTGDVDLQTLRLIGSYKGRQDLEPYGAGFYLGVYADVLTGGRVRLGDAVTLL